MCYPSFPSIIPADDKHLFSFPSFLEDHLLLPSFWEDHNCGVAL